MVGTQYMLNTWKNGEDDPEMVAIVKECEVTVYEMFFEAAGQEKEWAKYLFSKGSMIGLNEQILSTYVEYITNIRMKAIGLVGAFPETTQNPIPWINTWLSSDTVQVAPQEVELSSYLVGQIDSVIDEDLGEFEL